MPIQLKSGSDGPENKDNNEIQSSFNSDFGKYGREEDERPDFLKDDINDLPTYKAYTAKPVKEVNVESTRSRRKMVSIIITSIFVLGILILLWKGINYVVGSGGKDITENLALSEDEISKNLGITFEDNNDRAKWIPQYSGGTVTVRSGDELHVVYINGKQAGVNTDSRKYRFFNVGINDAEYDALNNMTFEYDDSYSVLNDMMEGDSNAYFYCSKKNKDCLVLVVSDKTNRIVSMTYYTSYKKVTAALSGVDED